jgi:hypothetical protein
MKLGGDNVVAYEHEIADDEFGEQLGRGGAAIDLNRNPPAHTSINPPIKPLMAT